jgi:hypothetical protein
MPIQFNPMIKMMSDYIFFFVTYEMPSSFIGEISRNTSKKGDNPNTIIQFLNSKFN